MNINVLRTYLLLNECGDDPLPGWQKLHNEFTRRYPNVNLTEQNLVDRKNIIVKNKYLSRIEIDLLRREIGNELNIINETSEQHEFEERDELTEIATIQTTATNTFIPVADTFLATSHRATVLVKNGLVSLAFSETPTL